MNGAGPTVTLVVAAAGYGKRDAVRARLRGISARWLTGDTAADVIRGVAADDPPRCLVLDDPAVPDTELAAWLDRTKSAQVMVIRRRPVAVGLPGAVTELGPADLALSATRVGRVLAEHGLADHTDRVHAATGGWPALVRLAGRALAERAATPASLRADRLAELIAGPGTGVAEFLVREVLDRLAPDARDLLSRFADWGPVNVKLCREMGFPHPEDTIDGLFRTGLLLPRPAGGFRLVPVLAVVARGSSTVDFPRVASWYARHGEPGAAARLYQRHGDHRCVAAVLTERGDEVLAGEGARFVLDLVDGTPHVGRRQRLLRAEALAQAGELTGARVVLDGLAAERLDAEVAASLARLEFRRGRPRAALDIGLAGAEESAAHLALGDRAAGVRAAMDALRAATASGDRRALAAAHLAMGVAGEAVEHLRTP